MIYLIRINRTSVELKLAISSRNSAVMRGINRTSVELKLSCVHGFAGRRIVLIAPVWN